MMYYAVENRAGWFQVRKLPLGSTHLHPSSGDVVYNFLPSLRWANTLARHCNLFGETR